MADLKNILVSGGTRGLGATIVDSLLADESYRVATFGRRATPTIEAWQSDPALASRFYFAPADMTDESSLHQFVEAVQTRWGAVEILVNNAGIALDGVLALVPNDDIDRLLYVNLRGPLILTRLCVRSMLSIRRGKIVNISSIVGLRGYRGLTVYSATKAAVDGWTRSLARELGGRGITVNSIAPGYLRTEMSHGLTDEQMGQIARRTPLGRLGEPEDVTPLLHFLIGPQSDFITGQTFVVDGGLTC